MMLLKEMSLDKYSETGAVVYKNKITDLITEDTLIINTN
jgi:hypothetical protein